MRVLTTLLGIASVLLGGCGLGLSWWAYSLGKRPFNSEGRYFDPNEGIILDTDSVAALYFVGFVLVGAALGMLLLRIHLKRSFTDPKAAWRSNKA